MPFSWSGTGQPQMCTCPKVSLSWECHRCGKINAPWKGSCDCIPSLNNNFPYNNPPTSATVTQGYPIGSNITYTPGVDPYNHCYETNNFIKDGN